MAAIVLLTRFLLELATIIGIFSGVFLHSTLYQRVFFAFLACVLTFIWARYGAPKSPTALTGRKKFILEITVYSIGTLAFFSLFGIEIASCYVAIAGIDLWLMYRLNLQGH